MCLCLFIFYIHIYSHTRKYIYPYICTYIYACISVSCLLVHLSTYPFCTCAPLRMVLEGTCPGGPGSGTAQDLPRSQWAWRIGSASLRPRGVYDMIPKSVYNTNAIWYVKLHYSLHCVPLRSATLRYVTLRYVTLRYVTLRYVTLRYVTLRYVTFYTLHYSTLHMYSLCVRICRVKYICTHTYPSMHVSVYLSMLSIFLSIHR